MAIVMYRDADDNLVATDDACPGCGERDADMLVWLDDERVQCQSCTRVYRPQDAGKGGDT